MKFLPKIRKKTFHNLVTFISRVIRYLVQYLWAKPPNNMHLHIQIHKIMNMGIQSTYCTNATAYYQASLIKILRLHYTPEALLLFLFLMSAYFFPYIHRCTHAHNLIIIVFINMIIKQKILYYSLHVLFMYIIY